MPLTVQAAAFPALSRPSRRSDAVLDKAVEQAEARKIQPRCCFPARLAPDMLAFTRQIQLCCDFAKNVVGRLRRRREPPLSR